MSRGYSFTVLVCLLECVILSEAKDPLTQAFMMVVLPTSSFDPFKSVSSVQSFRKSLWPTWRDNAALQRVLRGLSLDEKQILRRSLLRMTPAHAYTLYRASGLGSRFHS